MTDQKMNNSLLDQAFNPTEFERLGTELIGLLKTYLTQVQSGEVGVNQWKPPAETLDYWSNYSFDKTQPLNFIKDLINQSIYACPQP